MDRKKRDIDLYLEENEEFTFAEARSVLINYSQEQKISFYRLHNYLGWVHDFNKEDPDTPTIKKDLFGPLDVPWISRDYERKMHVEHRNFVWDNPVRTVPFWVHERHYFNTCVSLH